MIGAGKHASRNIYPYFHFLDGVDILANADLDEAKGKAVARAFGVPRTYTDYRRMLEEERPDGVIVCVGPAFHAQVAPELMELGYHVYTEKPPANSSEDARRMLAVQRKTGRICMVAFKKRFAPAYVKAKEIIVSEEFGRPLLLNALRTTGSKSEDPSDYLLPWGCHAIDLLPFLFGPVKRVFALTSERRTLAYSINVEFDNGAVGNLSVSNRSGCWEEVSAIGSSFVRVVVTNSTEMLKYRYEEPVSGHKVSYSHGACSSAIEQGFVGELQEFVDAIREGREPVSSIADAAHSMAVYDAIERSPEARQAVDVEPVLV